jgi:hypothetical protein
VAGHELSLGISVGVGQYPAHGKEADGLLRKALAQAAGAVAVGAGAATVRRAGPGSGAANDEA